MADGMKRAVLAAIATQGPWKTVDGPVLAEQVVTLYEGIVAKRESPWFAAKLGQRGDRTTDRALQVLRKAGLIKYVNGEGWVAS